MINQILIGDVLEKLKEIPDQYVNMVVTSPPYWGLRSYGNKPQIWGGDKDCDHEWEDEQMQREDSGRNRLEWSTGGNPSEKITGDPVSQGSFCCKCGAWLGNLGLEPTPELFIKHIIEIFREVRRVLRDDGTLWLNLGDSYATGGNGGHSAGKYFHGHIKRNGDLKGQPKKAPPGLKPKDVVGIPWMVAFALRADGWYLRQDIIWHKSNPMPESVTDRCTKAHEYIFLLSKSRQYYYDADAIRESAISDPTKVKMPDGWDTGPGGHGSFHRNGREKGVHKSAITPGQTPHTKALKRMAGKKDPEYITRNKRSVWTVSTKPFPGAHFATFPPDLIEPCILAGCPRDGIVLDPFFGSGTVGLVALKNARHYVGIELNPEYAEMARNRIEYGTVDEEKIIEEKKQGTLFND